MWTNVFRVGELQLISWFQFLPIESDQSLHERSSKAEIKDAATCSVLAAHLQLQSDGFLSTWTNSFVGPWDPSQGVHNPDEKIKLWLFLPGRHSSIMDTAQSAVSRLRVVGRGLWIAPGDSEEVALALSQALRNSIERALRGLSYMRFGDVFAKSYYSTPSGKSFRKAQPTCEFIFSATEEAIYIHAIISAKHVRNLISDDIEGVLRHRSSNFKTQALPVVVSPSGMRGRLTGCCPADLVKQVYSSKVMASNEGTHVLSSSTRSSGCQLRGQSCFVEVTLGCSFTRYKETLESNNRQQINAFQHNMEELSFVSPTKGQQTDPFPILERTFIFPAESVLVPVLHRSFAKSSTKRFCIRNWKGTSHADLWPFVNLSGSSQIEHCEFLEGLGIDICRLKRKYNGSSNSNCSSTSSTSSMSSGSNKADGIVTGDLEADADSFTSRQSGLSCNDQFDNDGHKMTSKRPRSSLTDAFGQAATVAGGTVQNGSKSEFSVTDANNTGTGGAANVQVGFNWDWDDDDSGIGIDIQALLSEFGDFGDFFESDVLNFGEPPGTAESQALALPSIDCGDISGSPCTMGIDSPDQKVSVVGNSSFENFNQPSFTSMDDSLSRSLDAPKDVKPCITTSQSLPSSPGKFDYLTKAEAVLTFAPEYAAVEASSSEFCTSIFRNPYLPGSKRVESSPITCSAYVYSSEPPSPHTSDVEEKYEKSSKTKAGVDGYVASSSSRYGKVYTNVQSVTTKMADRRLINDDIPSQKVQKASSLSILNSASGISPMLKKNDNTFEAGHFLLSLETVLATEFECLMFQAAMCRIRHTLLSFSKKVSTSSSKLTGNAMLDMISYDSSGIPDMIPSKLDVKKKDTLPVRIAGDIDMRMMDASLTAQVGVWRPVGVPKGTKPSTTYVSQNSPSLPLNASNEESYAVHGQRQPLQELIDSIGLLVQQAASFVDICLDTDDGDDPHTWLALQEQQRRGFSCSPFMVHAGCGGTFSLCHYVDIAGIELIDPLSADIQVSNVTSLLQSDIRFGLKSAFSSLEGPLSLTEWCRGRHQLGDSGTIGDAYSFQFSMAESKDALSSVSLGTEPICPPQSGINSSSLREGVRNDDSSQRRLNQDMCGADNDAQKLISRSRPTIAVLPVPALLVGYQDDWLKTSITCLQLWEKAPLEPYALPKPVVYYAICPEIDLLISAATDFFHQLGTVYEACKLGSHTPQNNSGFAEALPGKLSSCGLVPVKCPQELKTSSSNMWSTSSISDYFVTLSKVWNAKDFINSLKKVLKDLKFIVNSSPNQKEGNSGPFMVLYVVCPFPDATAVLQTLIACSAALGSVVLEPDKEKQSFLHSQVAKALVSSAAVDEAAASNVVMLSGFRIPKLVLQIVTVDCLLRLNRPSKELAMYKDIAFTVYNKARRISRTFSGADVPQPSAMSGRLQTTLSHVSSLTPGIWKDCLAPRISGSAISREAELDATLRPVAWDNSWQNARIGGLNGDPVRSLELVLQDDSRYMFEPFFVLAEPGYVDHGASVLHSVMSESSSSKSAMEDNSSVYMQGSSSAASSDVGKGSLLEGAEHENKVVNLHCSYGWTEDWRWLICFWTDSRGELLDCSIFPFGGISSRQDTKVLQNLFIQVLHHTCQILSGSLSDSGNLRQRDIVITRIGCFFELECQEWQRAIYSVGGNEVKKWPIQLRRAMPDGVISNNGASLEQQEMGLIQDRTLPSSPSPLYSPHAKSSFIKGGQTNAKKQILGGPSGLDGSRGLLQLARSISLVSVSMDHSLHLILPSDPSCIGAQNSSSILSSYMEVFSSVKSLGSTPASYLLIPSPGLRFLPPSPTQLPTCLTADSPPLAHLLHSKGSAIPQSTAFVVAKSAPAGREDWPCVLAVGLVDHYGGGFPEKAIARGGGSAGKPARPPGPESGPRDHDAEAHSVLESIAAELHALSWMTVSPLNADRRSPLPFHCDVLLRLRRLLHYAEKELSVSDL
ncbi:hypothetical protein HPP92_009540 [Vanilla planifolia]|uniref:Mediator of RNA polymerase II transcription subunit 13 n=1 Tax=Vanilla planifolia TaxID=51239 RepID=A0A835R8D1_VANPL|nr:hypothetical protein HPP92_009540 [Vanilla planifolia]